MASSLSVVFISAILLCAAIASANATSNFRGHYEDVSTASMKSSRQLRVMTLNIRNSNPNNGENNITNPDLYKHAAWVNRRDMIIRTIEEQAPDILGLQEVLADQHDYIVERLGSKYSIHGVGRDDGIREGEFAPVIFRNDRFRLLDSGTFWLSHTPGLPGSKYEGAGCVRICSWAKLIKIDDGILGDPLSFLFANTHLDNISEDARSFGSQLVSDLTHKIANGEPIILTGDFNLHTEREKGYRILVNDTGWTDSFADLHGRSPIVDNNPRRMTYHGFGNPTGPRIDFVFHPKAHFDTEEAYIVRDSGDPAWVSDHYAVVALLSTTQGKSEGMSLA